MAQTQPVELIVGDLGSGKILVPYKLNGLDRKFVLDTGASFSHINFDRETSSLVRTGPLSLHGAGGVEKNGDWVSVARLEIGLLSLLNVTIGRFADAGRDNLGTDLLLNRITELKISDRSLIFHEIPPRYANDIPIEILRKNQLCFESTVGDASVSVLFDTGAELNSVDSEFVKAHPQSFKFVQRISGGFDITGSTVEMSLYECESLSLGGIKLPLERILSFNFGPFRQRIGKDVSVLIGFNSVIRADWAIDLVNRRLGVRLLPK